MKTTDSGCHRTQWIGLVCAGVLCLGGAAYGDPVGFNRDIRPILSGKCFHCHGPDEKERQADLRLDVEEGIENYFRGGVSESEGLRRILSSDLDEKMPPADSHKDLKPAEIDLIKQWVGQGAPFEGHWSFITPRRPSLPQVEREDWVRNPIDRFILAKLEAQGLSPSDEARKERLLRRVTFDLTGLPPSLEQIEDFVRDTDPNAYQKVVDRLLSSEHFGERMAVNWMDAARYGDTSVFHADGPRDMWPWRDWVINAYNQNKPFNEFSIEQLAGDLIPNSTLDQRVASGFHRNNPTTDEGGAIAEEYRVEYAVDRVQTTATVWMGLTMQCGQCHEHKYDPISQREYYRFFAYFNQASDPGMQTRGGNQAPVAQIFAPDRDKIVARLNRQIEQVEQQQQKRRNAAETEFANWLAKASADPEAVSEPTAGMLFYAPLDETEGQTVSCVRPEKHQGDVKGKAKWSQGKFDGSLTLDGSSFVNLGDLGDFERDRGFSYGAWIKPQGAGSGAPIARMNDGNAFRGYDLFLAGGTVAVHIIHNWPGNAVKVTTHAKLKPDQWQHVFMTYDGSSKAAGIKIYFDGKPQKWRIEQDRLTKTIRAKTPLQLGKRSSSSPFKGSIDDVRLYDRTLSDDEVAALAGANPIGNLLALAPDKRTEDQTDKIRSYFLNNVDAPSIELARQVTELKAGIDKANSPVTTVMVMTDVPKPRTTFMLNRGAYDSPMKDSPVEPGVPAFLPPLPQNAEPNRLGMAKWLFQEEHPLTARVAVNRYWYMLFGNGIVETVEDFGSQGAWPSHPALLDWLAVEFQQSGWNVKHILKLMVTSATYRQTSTTTPELLNVDPRNRLYARGPRFRLQGEFVRDMALSISGLLTPKIGGPGVKPYQPPGLWNEVSLSGNVRFTQDHGAKLYRRSMYTYWKRSAPAPSMTLFDVPTRDRCVVRRSRTNTPLQALVTLNDPQFVEAARALAERSMKETGSPPAERISYGFRLATAVAPSQKQLSTLLAAYEEELKTFRADAERAAKLLSVGESKRDPSLDQAEHAALTAVMSILLNMDETLTRS